MATSSGDSRLWFPSDVGVAGVAEELVCKSRADSSTNSHVPTIAIPGKTESAADALLRELANVSSIDDLARATVFAAPGVLDVLIEERNGYIQRILDLKKEWEAAGKPYNQQWSEYLYDAREKVRIQVRNKSVVPRKFYDVTDDIRLAVRQEALVRGAKSGTPYAKVVQQDYKGAIEGALSPNDRPLKLLKISRAAFRVLQIATVVVSAVRISRLVAALYDAKTPKEEEAAMRAVFAASGEELFQGVGTAGGAILCSTITFSSAGVGFVTCGVMTAGGSALGEIVGRYAGDGAFAAYQFLTSKESSVIGGLSGGAPTPVLP